jgi:hypothetical protein
MILCRVEAAALGLVPRFTTSLDPPGSSGNEVIKLVAASGRGVSSRTSDMGTPADRAERSAGRLDGQLLGPWRPRRQPLTRARHAVADARLLRLHSSHEFRGIDPQRVGDADDVPQGQVDLTPLHVTDVGPVQTRLVGQPLLRHRGRQLLAAFAHTSAELPRLLDALLGRLHPGPLQGAALHTSTAYD